MSKNPLDMKATGWNMPFAWSWERTSPVAKLEASHSRWKCPESKGKVRPGVEVTGAFRASKACCSGVSHDHLPDFWVRALGRQFLRNSG